MDSWIPGRLPFPPFWGACPSHHYLSDAAINSEQSGDYSSTFHAGGICCVAIGVVNVACVVLLVGKAASPGWFALQDCENGIFISHFVW